MAIEDLIPKFKSKGTTIISNAERIFQSSTDFIRGNPIISTAALGAGTTGIVAVATTIRKRRKKKKKTSTRKKRTTRKRKTKKRKSSKKKTRRGRRTPRTAGKGKDRSTRRIRYTKKGQPYVITRSGKAKFIKKSSAKRSHRRKGGRY